MPVLPDNTLSRLFGAEADFGFLQTARDDAKLDAARTTVVASGLERICDGGGDGGDVELPRKATVSGISRLQHVSSFKEEAEFEEALFALSRKTSGVILPPSSTIPNPVCYQRWAAAVDLADWIATPGVRITALLSTIPATALLSISKKRQIALARPYRALEVFMAPLRERKDATLKVNRDCMQTILAMGFVEASLAVSFVSPDPRFYTRFAVMTRRRDPFGLYIFSEGKDGDLVYYIYVGRHTTTD